MRVIVSVIVVALALAIAPAAGAWTWPLEGAVLRPFSTTGDPYAAGQHRGVDVARAGAEAVRAPASGTVSFAGAVAANGLAVTILTADGLAVTLVHLGSIDVAKGAAVVEGAVVGASGPSGEAEWPVPYVHLGVRVASDPNGYLDPLSLLPPRTVAPPPVEPPPPPVPTSEPAQAVVSPEPVPAAVDAPAQPAAAAPPPPSAPSPAVAGSADPPSASAAPTAAGVVAPIDRPAPALRRRRGPRTSRARVACACPTSRLLPRCRRPRRPRPRLGARAPPTASGPRRPSTASAGRRAWRPPCSHWCSWPCS
jgi:hypothetical protein